MRGVARRLGDREAELRASHLRTVALLELGDGEALVEHAAFVALAETTGLPRFRYLALSRQGTIAILQGRFEDARRLVEDARALGQRLGEADAGSVRADQLWELARLQGRDDELAALLAGLRAAGDPRAVGIEAAAAIDRGDTAHALRLAEPGRD